MSKRRATTAQGCDGTKRICSNIHSISAAIAEQLTRKTSDSPDADALELVLDPLIDRISMSKQLQATHPPAVPELPIVTRQYEESFMRSPTPSEQPCVAGQTCECMMIDSDKAFVGVQFQLPDLSSQADGFCILCLRKLTHLLYHKTLQRGMKSNVLIQKYGNICGEDGEYHPSAMLICPPSGPVHTMPLPIVAHQRTRYFVTGSSQNGFKIGQRNPGPAIGASLETDAWLSSRGERPPCPHEEEFDSEVQRALLQQRCKRSTEDSLVKYRLVAYLFRTRHTLLHVVPWRFLLPSSEHLLMLTSMPDVCMEIHNLLHGMAQKTAMARLLQFSLPFVKHNRMSFPNVTCPSAILTVGRMLHATCTGLYPTARMLPTWSMQVLLAGFFWRALSAHNTASLLAFCSTHSSIVRLALFENFLYNISHNMPADHDFLFASVGTTAEITGVKRALAYAVDQFRLDSMQQDTLDWADVNQRAATVIEKCNRLCKLPQIHEHTARVPPCALTAAQVHDAMALPVIADVSYTRAVHERCSRLHDIASQLAHGRMHQAVQVYDLPRNVYAQQMRRFHANLVAEKDVAVSRSMIHVCLLCNRSSVECVGAIRLCVDAALSVQCGKCLSSQALFRIFVPGRLIRVHQTYFFWCMTCRTVHKWAGTGTEFQDCCPLVVHPERKPQARCVVCAKSQQITQVSVLNDELGCMESVHLCASHLPYEHAQKYVYNIQTLVRAIRSKRHRH